MTFAERQDDQARRIAARIDERAVGFDPISILFIISALISIFVNCWSLQHPTAEYATVALRDERKRKPDKLLRRATRRVKKEAKREGRDLTDKQAEIVAQAMLDEALAKGNEQELLTTMRETPAMVVDPDEPDDEPTPGT